jgi:thiol-disulfide isomerase/thioredoxin
VRRPALWLLIFVWAYLPLPAQDPSDAVSRELAQGDLYQSKQKFDLALEAYQRADKLAHHSSALCYLRIATVERKLGDFSSALENAKRAVNVAGDDKSLALHAHLVRATLLSQMSNKPTDKKLREAEEDIRQALMLDPSTAVAHYDLGFVLLKQERDTEGLAELQMYVDSPKTDPTTLADARRLIANPVRARAPFAPDFSLTTEEGQKLSNDSLRGKVVLLDFWGTWCPPCRESVPMLRDLNKRYSGKAFQLVSISSDEDVDTWKSFITQEKMDWSEYIDLQGNVLNSFKVESFPTYIVLDKDGIIRFRQSGLSPSSEMDLEDSINKALKRDSDPQLAAALAAESQLAPAPLHRPTPLSVSPAAEGTAPAVLPEDSRQLPHLLGATESRIEDGVVTGNVYKNRALHLTFEFPPDWIAANSAILNSDNDRGVASSTAAILQHQGMADSPNLSAPKLIFYASKKGTGDGQRIDIPSIRITALPSHGKPLTLDSFRRTTAQIADASSMQVTSAPSEFRVDDHAYFRTDLQRAIGAKYYTTVVQTLAGDYLLHIELFAYSKGELDQIASALEAITISGDNP